MKNKYLKFIFSILDGYKRKYVAYLLLLLVAVLLETISVFMYKILIDLLQYPNIVDFTTNVQDPLTNFFVNILGGYDFLSKNLWIFSIFIVSFALGIAIGNVSRIILRTKIMTGVSKKIQLKLFNHLERLNYRSLKHIKNGDIIQTCTRDEESLRRFIIGDMHMIFYTLFILIISFTILVIISWQVALGSICLLIPLFVYSFFVIKPCRTRYRETDDSEGLMTARIEENLASVRLVKAYNNEKFEIDNFETYLQDYKTKFIKWRIFTSFFFSSTDILVFSQIEIATIIAILLCVQGQITASIVMVTFTYVSRVVWPLRDVATTLSNLAKVIASIDRMLILLNEPQEDIHSGLRPEIQGNVTFKNVTFQFEDADTPILKNISFDIKRGQTVAILGKTGAGKSTLANLLTRLYDANEGQILIDGLDITSISKEHLRRNVSIALQEPFLFSKSISSNIKITSKDITDEDVQKATRITHIHDSILGLKDGYNTQVGEKGVALSGGQKQRVAMARSIINKAPILIFDDSLSAVDTQTDIEIRTNLKTLMKDTTTFIITHRVATAKDADVIIVLEDNSISQMGTYSELIQQEGLFKRINEIQTKMK